MRGAAWAARRRAGQQWPRSPGSGPGPPPLLPPPPPLLLLLLLLLGGASAQYSSDLCSWKGRFGPVHIEKDSCGAESTEPNATCIDLSTSRVCGTTRPGRHLSADEMQ
ncbi:hypothetical protein ACRRTK_008082 [Alexandromys fortis]